MFSLTPPPYLSTIAASWILTGALALGSKLALAAAPAATPPKNAVEELRSQQEQVKAFSHLTVEFRQETYRDLRKKTSTSQGKAYFSKPSSFRWVLADQEWIYDGKNLSHYLPEKKEALHYSAQGSQGKDIRQIVDIVLNFDQLLENFNVQSSDKKDDVLYLSLTPKTARDIESADIQLDTKKHFIQLLKLNFRNKNHTTLHFSNPDKKAIEASQFQIPSTIKVIEAT